MQTIITSNLSRAKVATTALILCGVAALFLALSELWLSFQVRKLGLPAYMQEIPEYLHNDDTASASLIYAGAMLLFFISYLVSVVFFLMWFRRAYANLQKFKIVRKYSPAWAVGYWFIPLLHMFRPYEVMREMYDNMSSFLKRSGETTYALPNPSLAKTWWIWWLISTIGARFVSKLTELSGNNFGTPISYADQLTLGFFMSLSVCVAAYYAVVVLKDFSRGEEKVVAYLATAEAEMQNE
jgi:hypothetical protein